MDKATFKPVTEKQVGLTPDEIKELVTGAQAYLPPETEDGEPIPTEPHANRS